MQPLSFSGRTDMQNNISISGMTRIPVTLEELVETRKMLFDTIPSILSDNEKMFLSPLKKGIPDWTLLPIPNIDRFPAIRWKLHNIKQLDKKKHQEQLRKFEMVLGK
jgi:hypothetical protein